MMPRTVNHLHGRRSDPNRKHPWSVLFFAMVAGCAGASNAATPALVVTAPHAPGEETAGAAEVLVVLSNRNAVALRAGKTLQTGYFLNGLLVPVKPASDEAFVKAFLPKLQAR